MINQFLLNVRSRPEILILFLVIMIIAMLVIPLPTYLVDFLIGLNIVISVLVFLASFYIDRILSFSTFPAVLLITTLFRLALSISTSRLILNDADAGAIIETFGLFVIGDNLIVGFVIFGIVTIVQFMVITKGSERVAEVAARFSLDGMPGKQMSIDADVKAGVLDSEGAKEKRSILERESQLYGAFDGAMKFIKGDAIAGIIVIFINFIGGISVGMSQHGMDLSTALTTFTMLTIGDGLVAQIPSLLIAISSGFIVTRVSGDGDNMGKTIMSQLLDNQFILVVTAVLALCIGLLPGFPFFIFLIISVALIGLYYYKRWQKTTGSGDDSSKKDQKSSTVLTRDQHPHDFESSLNFIESLDKTAVETVPLLLLVPPSQYDRMEKNNLAEHIRSQFFIDYGIHLPEMLLRKNSQHLDNHVLLLINEILVSDFTVYFDHYCIVNAAEEVEVLDVSIIKAGSAMWVDSGGKKKIEPFGYHLRPAIDELYRCIETSLSRYVSEYFGIQETKTILDMLEKKYPELLKEVIRHATTQRVSEVLQRLLSERISVRNMKLILETLALWAPKEKDVIILVEHVRGALSRYICNKFSTNNSLRVLLVSAEIEDSFRQGIRNTSSGNFLSLEPAVSDELMDRFSLIIESLTMAHKDYVILSSVDVRRFVKKFIEQRFKDLEVVSFGEVNDQVSVDVMKTI